MTKPQTYRNIAAGLALRHTNPAGGGPFVSKWIGVAALLILLSSSAGAEALFSFSNPMWSHDGKQVAYLKIDVDQRWVEVWTCGADGSHTRRLARFPEPPG